MYHPFTTSQLAVEDSENLAVRLGIYCGQGKPYKEVFPVCVSSGAGIHD